MTVKAFSFRFNQLQSLSESLSSVLPILRKWGVNLVSNLLNIDNSLSAKKALDILLHANRRFDL